MYINQNMCKSTLEQLLLCTCTLSPLAVEQLVSVLLRVTSLYSIRYCNKVK
jgi:hypothetical protein